MLVGRRAIKKSVSFTKRYLQAAGILRKPETIETSDELWSLYKQGCYRTIVKSGFKVETGRDAIAMAVSRAACGKLDSGRRLINQYVKSDEIKRLELLAAAKVFSRFGHEAGLALIKKHKKDSAFIGLYLTLLFALKRDELARNMAHQPAAKKALKKEADILLLQANCETSQDKILDILNVFLARHHLAPLERKNKDLPVSASNLTCVAPPATVRGPLVTITVPAYNTGERIGSAIESLLAQTYRDIEIIVVDDCSSDNTVAVIKGLIAKDSRVRLVERTRNGGPYAARNMALKLAKGDFITCHDSDDWAHPEKIQRQVEPLLSIPALKFTISKWVKLEDNGRFSGVHLYPLTRVNPASPMFRRTETLEKLGYYDRVRTGADTEYIGRLKQVFGPKSWIELQLPLVFGAQRSDSLTGSSQTGTLVNGAMNPSRLTYWEAWRKKHRKAWNEHLSLYGPYWDE